MMKTKKANEKARKIFTEMGGYTREPIANKPHTCDICDKEISPKTKYKVLTPYSLNHTYRFHKECYK